jgi:hypothetical protein
MQAKRIRAIRYQLKTQTAKRRKTIYIAVGALIFVITAPQIAQIATRVFWQVTLEVVSELIALFIASKIQGIKVK